MQNLRSEHLLVFPRSVKTERPLMSQDFILLSTERWNDDSNKSVAYLVIYTHSSPLLVTLILQAAIFTYKNPYLHHTIFSGNN